MQAYALLNSKQMVKKFRKRTANLTDKDTEGLCGRMRETMVNFYETKFTTKESRERLGTKAVPDILKHFQAKGVYDREEVQNLIKKIKEGAHDLDEEDLRLNELFRVLSNGDSDRAA